MRKFLAIVGALLTVTGCSTTLNTQHVSANREPNSGVLYNLPMAVFDAEARFLVRGCAVTTGGSPVLAYELVAGSATLHLEPDPLEIYNLRYDLLNSPLKITAVTVKHHPNKMIKSLTADVDDRSAQVIASVGNAVLNLAKAASLASVSPTSLGLPCPAFMADRLAERQKIQRKDLPDLKAADKEERNDEAAVASLTKKLKADRERLGKLREQKSDAKAEEIKQLSAHLEDTQFRIDLALPESRKAKSTALQSRLTLLTEELTVTARYVGWSPRQTTDEKVCQDFSSNQLDYWNRLSEASFAQEGARPSATAKFIAVICVQVPQRARRGLPALDALPTVNEREYAGVVYLLPATGYVFVGDKLDDGVKFYSTSSVSLPQFGAKGLVWLKNEPFDNNSVSALFNDDGSMSELSFKAASRAERGAAAAVDASKSLADLMQLRVDAAKAKVAATDAKQKKEHQNQIDAIDSQIAVTTKNNELEVANASASDPLSKEKALLQKQIEVEKLRQEYQAVLKRKAE